LQAIERIYIQNPDSNTGVQVRLAYDDTPGSFDTISEDRGRINDLLRKYDEHYYPRILPNARLTGVPGRNRRGKLYPNAILLVTTWDSIRGKCHALRETMGNLRKSGLIDHEHPNVIVVVTRSLSSWDDYEDFDDDEKKNQWQEDADKKKRIIDDLRLEVFPSSASWQVVFIENGGGESIVQDFKRLPNGELSHQNLFDAIYKLFVGADRKGDLVGLEALRFLTGDHSIVSRLRPSPVETLLRLDDPVRSIRHGILLNLTDLVRIPNVPSAKTVAFILAAEIATTSPRSQRTISEFATILFVKHLAVFPLLS